MSDQAVLMGQREYARHRKSLGLPGGTHPAIAKAIDAGRLVKSITIGDKGRILIDPAKADLEWGATTDPAQQREADEVRKPGTPASNGVTQTTITGDPEAELDGRQPTPGPLAEYTDRARVGFAVQRARTAAAKAEIAELDLAERRGDLISIVKVQDEAYKLGVRLREAVMAVPRRLQSRMPAKLVPVLEDELRKALKSLETGMARGPGGRDGKR